MTLYGASFSSTPHKWWKILRNFMQIYGCTFYVCSGTFASCPKNTVMRYKKHCCEGKTGLIPTSRKYEMRRSFAVNKYRFLKSGRKNMFVDHPHFCTSKCRALWKAALCCALAVTATFSWSLDISGPMGPLNPPWCMRVSAVKIPPCTRSSLVSQYTPFSYCKPDARLSR